MVLLSLAVCGAHLCLSRSPDFTNFCRPLPFRFSVVDNVTINKTFDHEPTDAEKQHNEQTSRFKMEAAKYELQSRQLSFQSKQQQHATPALRLPESKSLGVGIVEPVAKSVI